MVLLGLSDSPALSLAFSLLLSLTIHLMVAADGRGQLLFAAPIGPFHRDPLAAVSGRRWAGAPGERAVATLGWQGTSGPRGHRPADHLSLTLLFHNRPGTWPHALWGDRQPTASGGAESGGSTAATAGLYPHMRLTRAFWYLH